MAFQLNNVSYTPGPSNERAAHASMAKVGNYVTAARSTVAVVDTCITRAPGGLSGFLDVIAALPQGATKVQQFYDAYADALATTNSFKQYDDDPAETDQITQQEVTDAIARI